MKGDMPERERHREYVRKLREAAPFLRAVKDNDIRQAETWSAIRSFDGLFESLIRRLPPRQTSGLVEFHERLRRLRR